MSDYVSYLLTILYEGRLLQVALCVYRDLLTGEEYDYPMENRKAFERFLPLHAQYPIVKIDEIFETVYRMPQEKAQGA